MKALHNHTLDGISNTVYTGSVEVPVSGDGSHTLSYGAKDVAGNEETVNVEPTIKIDTTLPSITILNMEEGGTYELGLYDAPTYTASDDTSGIASESSETATVSGSSPTA